jgi:hypothetical protein
MLCVRRSAQPRVEESWCVGQKIERGLRPVQSLDQLRHRREGMIEHLVETAIEGFDQGFLAGMHRLQLACGLSRIATLVLRPMPLRGGHGGEEALHFVRLRDQLAVEVAGVPVEQHAAQVEDRDRRPRRGRFWGSFGGQFDAFSGRVFPANLIR